MIIKSLELENFRNYAELSISFDSGTNILYGDNAQGKTNILESIYLSATTKSHKGSKDKELINFEAQEAHIRTYVMKDGLENRVDMHLRKNKTKGIVECGVFFAGGFVDYQKRSLRAASICGYGALSARQFLFVQSE